MKLKIPLVASFATLAFVCSPAAQADSFTLGASQDSMAYSFLSGWSMEALYPKPLRPDWRGKRVWRRAERGLPHQRGFSPAGKFVE
jgi:hypothetical protein